MSALLPNYALWEDIDGEGKVVVRGVALDSRKSGPSY